ncbi:hypothetical protein ACINNAV78_2891 [Acinetobacter baumannii Naval-78]|nr:hypothetical protein ACINNAV78_2891 [Acinetobacter baumannii Naval-78]
MKLKTVTIDGKVYAEVDGDKPIYIHDDGKEMPHDAPHSVATIARLNNEAKTHREAKEAAEKALKAFEGMKTLRQLKRHYKQSKISTIKSWWMLVKLRK